MPVTCENGIWKGEVKPILENWYEFRSILLDRLRKYPTRVSQIDATTDEKETYAQLADKVIRCSLWLRKQNLKADDVVSICSYRHLDTIVPFVASLLAGVIVHPWWDATLTDDTIEHFFKLTKPKIIFADETKAAKIRSVSAKVGADVRIIAFNDAPDFETWNNIILSQTAEEVANFECERIKDFEQTAMILCTSGSTGYPKGVAKTYGYLAQRLISVAANPAINYWSAGINWISGAVITLMNICECSTAIVHSNPDERIILGLIEKYKITGVLFVNTGYALRMYTSNLVRNYNVSSVKLVGLGGSTLDPKVDEYMNNSFPNANVSHGYGSTEIGGMCFRPKWTGKPVSCGFPATDIQIKIVDLNDGKILGCNEEGAIWVKSPYSTRYYYNSSEEALNEEGWYNTGDIGYYDEDGEFFVVDRLKDVIKFRVSYYYAPSVIERTIRRCPGVLEAAVVAKPHPEDVEQPMAFVTIVPNAKITENDIVDFVAQDLPDHMHLRGGVKILDQMPYTETGKIFKMKLKATMMTH